MVRVVLLGWCLALVAGCSPRTAAPGGGEEGVPTSGRSPGSIPRSLPAGRFPYAAIYRTSAPWDGPATQLLLSEKPLERGKLTEPRIGIVSYTAPDRLSGQRLQLDGIERERGAAIWIERDGMRTPLERAEVWFDLIRPTEPVTGRYEVAFPDGRRAFGRFRAEWWPAEGPGG